MNSPRRCFSAFSSAWMVLSVSMSSTNAVVRLSLRNCWTCSCVGFSCSSRWLPFSCWTCCSSCCACCAALLGLPWPALHLLSLRRLLHLLLRLLLHHLHLLLRCSIDLLLLHLPASASASATSPSCVTDRTCSRDDLGGDLLDVARQPHHLAAACRGCATEPYCDLQLLRAQRLAADRSRRA